MYCCRGIRQWRTFRTRPGIDPVYISKVTKFVNVHIAKFLVSDIEDLYCYVEFMILHIFDIHNPRVTEGHVSKVKVTVSTKLISLSTPYNLNLLLLCWIKIIIHTIVVHDQT